MKDAPLLVLKNLTVDFGGPPVVDHIHLNIVPGEVVGIVGESGSGKSVAMLAVMGLIDAPGRVRAAENHRQGNFDGVSGRANEPEPQLYNWHANQGSIAQASGTARSRIAGARA